MRELGLAIPIQPADAGYSRAMVALLTFYSVAAISPVWHVFGVSERHLFLAALTAVLTVSFLRGRALTRWVVPLGLLLFASAFAAGVYWAELRMTLYPMHFVVACLLLSQSTRREFERYVDVASRIVMVLVIGAVVGFFLARLGVEPLLRFPNPDGRPNFFFYTTLTNAYWSGWIQASGIYDEPGAFSFVICAVAFMRHILGRDYRFTWILLALGLVTFSLAHLVFISVFALAERLTPRRLVYLGATVALLVAIAYSVGLQQLYRDYLFARITLDTAQQRGAHDRLELARNAARELGRVEGAVIFGVDSDCTVNYMACRARWPYMAENPLGPMALHGLLLAWPYYLFLAAGLLFLLLGRRNFAFFALVLIFLQRPYVMSFGYSFFAVAGLWLQMTALAARREERLPVAPALAES
jgi:hypothetical protein